MKHPSRSVPPSFPPRPPILDRGFSLIGVITGLAVLGVTSAATVAMLEFSNRNAKQLSIKFDALALTRAVVDQLSSQSTCTANLDRSHPITPGLDHYDLILNIPFIATPILGIPYGETTGPYAQLADYQLTVRRFFMAGLLNTGLKGVHNLDLYQGDVTLNLRPISNAQIAINTPTLTRLYFEVDAAGAVQYCSTGDDPTLALAMACSKVGGTFTEAGLVCDMSAIHNLIVTNTRAQVNTLLQGDYYNYLISAADLRIDAAAGQVQANATQTAQNYTDVLAGQLNGLITTSTNQTNGNITQVNNALTANVNALWSALAGVNALSQASAALSAQANQTSASANAVSQSANATSTSANAYSNSALSLSSSANQTANAANQTSNAAGATANSANAVTASANNGINNANANSNAAYNNANAANGLTNAANGASSSAFNYANTAVAWANQANAVANNALNQSNQALNEAASANNWTNQAINTSNTANWYSNMSLSRGSTSNDYWSFTTRVCNYSPVPCSQQ